jgi:hypothetical protein
MRKETGLFETFFWGVSPITFAWTIIMTIVTGEYLSKHQLDFSGYCFSILFIGVGYLKLGYELGTENEKKVNKKGSEKNECFN